MTTTTARTAPYEWTDAAVLMVRTALGVTLSLVNTGGGCMCLIGTLEGGHELVIGDAWDSLSAWPEDMTGWGVAVHAPDPLDVGHCCPTVTATSADEGLGGHPSPTDLVIVIRRALHRLIDPAQHSVQGPCCASTRA